MAPIATRIGSELLAHKPLPASPLPIFYHILFSILTFLLSVAYMHRANSCLRLLHLFFPLSSTQNVLAWHICIHSYGCCFPSPFPLRSLFRTEGLAPQLLRVLPADSPQLSVPLGSCPSQGYVSLLEQSTFNGRLLQRQKCMSPLPQLGATLKGHLHS